MFTQANGDRFEVPNYMFIISDGNSNINDDETIAEAIRAKNEAIYIMTVSVGKYYELRLTGLIFIPFKILILFLLIS